MEPRNIFQRGGISLSLGKLARPDEIELATNTIFGTPGGTLYRHLDTPGRINKQHDPYFLSLRKSERLLGMVGYSQRPTYQPAGELPGYYIRYLSMMANFQRKTPQESSGKSKADGFIKRMISGVMDRPQEFSPVSGEGPDEALFYAYVEIENARSAEMTESLGFTPVGKFSTLPFSRFRPKAHPQVSVAQPEERDEIRAQLRDFYRDHALFTDVNLFFPEGEYFVFKDGDKIVGGLGAVPSHWIVEDMPGLSGKLIMALVPRIPFLSKLFNPSAFKFITTEGIWWADGYEDTVFDILESALHHFNLNTGLLWMDRKSKVDAVLRGGKLGILRRFHSDTPVSVIIRTGNVPEAILKDVKERPVYVSGYDSV